MKGNGTIRSLSTTQEEKLNELLPGPDLMRYYILHVLEISSGHLDQFEFDLILEQFYPHEVYPDERGREVEYLVDKCMIEVIHPMIADGNDYPFTIKILPDGRDWYDNIKKEIPPDGKDWYDNINTDFHEPLIYDKYDLIGS